MFAVIQTGGKQIKVSKDATVVVEKLSGSAGSRVEFPNVLMVGTEDNIQVGAPLVAGATVVGELVEQTRGDKVIIFKKNRRHNYRRKNGHRQELSVVKIQDILVEGEKLAVEKKPAKAKSAKAPKAPIEKTTPEEA